MSVVDDVVHLTLLFLLLRRRKRRRLARTLGETGANFISHKKRKPVVLNNASVTTLTPSMLLKANTSSSLTGVKKHGSSRSTTHDSNISDLVKIKEEPNDGSDNDMQANCNNILLQEVSIKEEPLDDWSGGTEDN